LTHLRSSGAQRLSAKEPWVRGIAEAAGIPLAAGEAFVNLPRHPSQLYEALFEGIALGASHATHEDVAAPFRHGDGLLLDIRCAQDLIPRQ